MNELKAEGGCASCAPASARSRKSPSEIPPSIFNDVVGPVMRGPSSSHCAAALRIGRMARDLMGGKLSSVRIEFDPAGSLATTHESQGSDMGLFGGLLGWEPADERLPESPRHLEEAGISHEIAIVDLGIPEAHPNTYRLSLTNDKGTHQMTALSTGGGMIEVTEIDGVDVSLLGDFHVALLPSDHAPMEGERATLRKGATNEFLEVLTRNPLHDTPTSAIHLKPVLPILSRANVEVPFQTSTELLTAAERAPEKDLADFAINYEAARGGISSKEVVGKMVDIVRLLRLSVTQGLAGTSYDDRILGSQSGGLRRAVDKGSVFEAGVLNQMLLQVTALMEVKSSMGVIVAAPTAGACGTFPGATLAAAEALELDERATARAFLAGGLIGVFIAAGSSFAAEVGGCQAETGSAASMAAAALVTMRGGDCATAMTAASIALQNTLGMICDPVANRVEAPCLGKNLMGVANALSCANIALAGFDGVIPFDEVVVAHYSVGNQMPSDLRCTAKGGLSITPTSLALEGRLREAKEAP